MDALHRLFGSGAHTAPHPPLDALAEKYRAVLELVGRLGGRVEELRLEGERLVLRATAPSPGAREAVLKQIERVDPAHSDLSSQVRIAAPEP